jgi:hypothetical protein
MSQIIRPRNPGRGGRPPEDLDALLRAYFRSEMPEPWPTLQPPADVVPPPARKRWPMNASRWVLAASVALLLVGQVVLSGKFTDYSSAKADGTFQPPVADRNGGKVRSYKVEVEEAIGPDGKVVPHVKSLTIRTEQGPGR